MAHRIHLPEILIQRLCGKKIELRSQKEMDAVQKYYDMSEQDCFELLKKITGKDFGTDLKRWNEWWREEKKNPSLSGGWH